MPFSYEQKVIAVNLVLQEQLSYLQAGRAVGASKNTVLCWVQRVEKHGFESLIRTEKRTHTGEFKVEVVEYMHKHSLSSYAAGAHFNLARVQIERWERIYYEEGAEALLIERRGRKSNGRPRKKTPEELAGNENLIAEVQRLRLENEYLKKVNALVHRRTVQPSKKKWQPSPN